MLGFLSKQCFVIKHIELSKEKIMFWATKGVFHYIVKRDLVMFANNDNFEFKICVKARGGRSARCMGTPPVAEMLASEARHARTRVHVKACQECVRRPRYMPFPGRSIERVLRDLATSSN